MRGKIINATLFLLLFFGVCLLLYPTLSNYWNSLHQTQAILSYEEKMTAIDDTDYSQYLDAASDYNLQLASQTTTHFVNGEAENPIYTDLLNINNDSIMGYVDIPNIHVTLPIYHGTSESVLSIGVGHLEGSSLPVGGMGTHTILSGHRGLTSAKLFTDLDVIREGDVFTLHILKEVLTYQVTDILIVEPYEIDSLSIKADEDRCTLVTCTPYGVNSHRLLVSGQRIENIEEAKTLYISTEAMVIDPMVVAPLVAMPILLVLGLWLICGTPNKKKTKKRRKSHET